MIAEDKDMDENDLNDLSNQEAWEDGQAEMRDGNENDFDEDDDELQRELEAEGRQDQELSDYENDTPLGQAYGDGFEE
jgi:hypothetical protein